MNVTVTALGAVIALVIAITLIIKKVHPAYGLILGALIGGLVGGAGLTGTVNLMMDGAKNMMPAILRILTAGVLAGVLIESGAAAKIAETIVEKIGESRALIALSTVSFLEPHKATLAPWSRNFFTVANPIPLVPPVTITTLFFMLFDKISILITSYTYYKFNNSLIYIIVQCI